tara:strand:- start:297 stop:488 length:192 start_codon:yes stop_codon:yes gene_type:complete
VAEFTILIVVLEQLLLKILRVEQFQFKSQLADLVITQVEITLVVQLVTAELQSLLNVSLQLLL